ncbi:hypothetical protein ABH930_001472 [Kitasatospora sp. GAS204A]|uniref:hypothetical protein n=1 Tax=unclassified Kitasatospora TaxID=2633591 RepID=UPI0024752E2E|nr:hypothetical protein [Kitasatospora sp. GAS204B]MDH6118472.1 hypothetical protein [Kitasatospora sp. GAS204B]
MSRFIGALSSRPAKAAAVAAVSSFALVGGVFAGSGLAQAQTAPAVASHAYRHGAVPKLDPATGHAVTAPDAAATNANNLNYGGAIDGIGVTTGAPKVYVIYWGSQWGKASTDSHGLVHLAGDKSGMAPDQQGFFKGLGSSTDAWSGVMTQYCQGIATGAQSCPAGAAHVGHPGSTGALAGVWEDTSAVPSAANGHQIALEAIKAAKHFGNTTAAKNRNVQYVITFPSGTNPDNYQSQGFCAWHDYNGDTTLSGGAATSPYGDIAFTNMPYLPDAGQSCGQGFVNSPGALDGVTIVGGHEYAETITDQNPAGGWTDSSGAENGDKCAWISSGQGASQNITLSTGKFAVQSTWGNDGNGGAGGCEVSHATVK